MQAATVTGRHHTAAASPVFGTEVVSPVPVTSAALGRESEEAVVASVAAQPCDTRLAGALPRQRVAPAVPRPCRVALAAGTEERRAMSRQQGAGAEPLLPLLSCPTRTSCSPRWAAARSSRAGRARRSCPSRAGGSGTGPCWDRSPPVLGLSHRGCNRKLREIKHCLHPNKGLSGETAGIGAGGRAPRAVGGHVPPSNGALGLSPCRAGYLWGMRMAVERGDKKPFLSFWGQPGPSISP